MAEPANGALRRRFVWRRPGEGGRLWLTVEFAALFIAIPVAIALFLPPSELFEALFLFSLAGLALLWFTGGFDWRALLRGWGRFDWRLFLGFAAITFTASVAVMYITRPEALFSFLRSNPKFLLVIWLFYPLLSALPQELIFRVLFFHRYGRIFNGPQQAVLANAAIFSLAHLMYWSWIVAVFTFFGGMAFAVGYLKRGFPWVWALHAIAGNILFAVGMGVYFYSGNAVRPF
ncbi:CPBP family intramembrane glutamic endopeptidase [Paracoccus sediminicola]|uniref:CPBP family intramembrane glutamic endopeptidase n=1 Tax=Paracoccus sediminicola TaxID=3017783 RepID=UPI0022F05170|nr:CPBP family intramembrane glutamic endopeptidase [Paracoccus sediminicola]WBU55905.1 CPBP family glutamic-type intramembrane protease [Paracoccus sediminicola]